jgi:glycosyltransferase involved in cell wall biosynthesis
MTMGATNGIPAGLASVIVPCFKQRQCVTAVVRCTRPPWELIVVDNGSTDSTAVYLAGFQDASPIPITVVSNPANRGYPTAVNQGLSAALGDFLVVFVTRKLFALIARCHRMLGDSATALQTCAHGLALDPDDAELLFRRAVVHRQRGETTEAESCWRRILTLRRPEAFCSIDQGIYGHLTRRNLAALATERGEREEAVRLWRAVLAECPGDREAVAKLRQLELAESVC